MSSSSNSIAVRAARWSATHRKRAIFGWLAFVIVAFMFGNAIVGSNPISTVDGFNGESRDAEKAADEAGLRPNGEVVFVQSDTLTIEDAEFEAAIEAARESIRISLSWTTSEEEVDRAASIIEETIAELRTAIG